MSLKRQRSTPRSSSRLWALATSTLSPRFPTSRTRTLATLPEVSRRKQNYFQHISRFNTLTCRSAMHNPNVSAEGAKDAEKKLNNM